VDHLSVSSYTGVTNLVESGPVSIAHPARAMQRMALNPPEKIFRNCRKQNKGKQKRF